jgi:hypothetical protein
MTGRAALSLDDADRLQTLTDARHDLRANVACYGTSSCRSWWCSWLLWLSALVGRLALQAAGLVFGRLDAGGEAAVGLGAGGRGSDGASLVVLRIRAARPLRRRHRRRLTSWGGDGGRVTLRDLVRLHRACDLMDRDDAMPLDAPALARTAFVSLGLLLPQRSRCVRGGAFSYLMMRWIERAKALLGRGDLPVTEVCMAVGCTLLGSVSWRFTEVVGDSPSADRTRRHDQGAAIPACAAKIHR